MAESTAKREGRAWVVSDVQPARYLKGDLVFGLGLRGMCVMRVARDQGAGEDVALWCDEEDADDSAEIRRSFRMMRPVVGEERRLPAPERAGGYARIATEGLAVADSLGEREARVIRQMAAIVATLAYATEPAGDGRYDAAIANALLLGEQERAAERRLREAIGHLVDLERTTLEVTRFLNAENLRGAK